MHDSSSERETTVALLTAPGRGAVATVALGGPKATQAIEAFFRPAGKKSSRDLSIGRIYYGTWGKSPQHQLKVQETGEGLVVSILGENEIEIHCHGGSAAVGRVLHDLQSFGCRTGSGWEWPRRLGPLELACYRAACEARTELTASIAWKQYQGQLRSSLSAIVSLLQSQEIVIAQKALQTLQQTAKYGLHLTRPWTIGIIGPPNVGKSSLLNAIVGWERAITSSEPGTTRDIVTVQTAVNGWPLKILDTAGIRETTSALEQEGILRARQVAQEADLLLMVVDATQGLMPLHHQWINPAISELSVCPPVLWVWNKADLEGVLKLKAEQPEPPGSSQVPRIPNRSASDVTPISQVNEFQKKFLEKVTIPSSSIQAIPTSATVPFGIDGLLQSIIRELVPEGTEAKLIDRGVILTDEQLAVVNQVIQLVENGDIPKATSMLQSMLSVGIG